MLNFHFAPAYAKIAPVSMLRIPAAEMPKFRRRLLAWYAVRKRDLPWRRTRDPYRIWLSEIMLQQTRVAAVIPYYERFLEALPRQSERWRAHRKRKCLRRGRDSAITAARAICTAPQKKSSRETRRRIPASMRSALALPGIGSYTAAAVLSIAYGEPHAVLDGNVARVLARLGAVHGDLRDGLVGKRCKPPRKICSSGRAWRLEPGR